MMRSLFSGVSGLVNHQVMLDVIGNNVANVNTYGFKSGRVTFREIFSQTLSTGSAPTGTKGGVNPQQVGLGMAVGSIDNLFLQGGLETTGRTEDLALDGAGFFVVSDGISNYYSRAGNFQVDSNGSFVSGVDGKSVMGWTSRAAGADGNPSIDTTGPLAPIVINYGEKIEAAATSRVDFRSNLNANESVAVGNILETQRMFVYPSAADSITEQLDYTTSGLDIDNGEVIRYTAGITGDTTLNNLFNTSGNNLDLGAGADTIRISIDGGVSTYDFGYTGATTTVENFMDFINTTVPEIDIRLDPNTGRFAIENTTGADINVAIDMITPNPTFASAFLGTTGTNIVPGAINAVSVNNALQVQSDFIVGTDGSTMNALGTWLQNALQLTSPTSATTETTVEYVNDIGGNPGNSGTFVYTVGSDLFNADLSVVSSTGDAPRFLANMGLDQQDIIAGGNHSSERFYSYAQTSDTLQNIMNANGDFLVRTDPTDPEYDGDPAGSGQDIIINGTIGDIEITDPGYLQISNTTTLEELFNTVERTFGIMNDDGVTISRDGRMQINADPGQDDEINLANISISTFSNDADFSATVSGFNEMQIADGGHKSSIIIYDGQGKAHNLNVYFEKIDENNWSWEATLPEDPDAALSASSGELSFSEGLILGNNPAPVSISVAGASQFAVSLNFTGMSEGRPNPLDGVTQYSDGDSDHTTRAVSQNGYQMGILRDIEVSLDGTIYGVYTNDKRIPVAVVGVANFQNEGGLLKSGNNLFSESSNSGIPVLGQAGNLGLGNINSGALEMSNVNLANEFTKMIVAQRGFQANAKTITTADTLLGELLSLKR